MNLASPDLDLLRAAAAADRNGVRRALRAGANPNCADGGGTTGLHFGVRRNSAGVVLDLLRAGADPHQCDARGDSPLAIAPAHSRNDRARS